VGPLLLLGEAVVGHPGFKEGLELVAGGLGGGAELWELEGEEGGEGGEVWCRPVDSAYTESARPGWPPLPVVTPGGPQDRHGGPEC
jgi:hypothetical protein